VKGVPGRKTDVNDAMWLADLLAHGLIRSSFVPPMAVQARRDLTRARKQLMRKRSRTFSGSTKTLQAANLKLGSVLSDIMGASGRAILDVLAQSQTDPECLADQVHTRIRASRAQLVEALRGRISDPPAPAAAHPPRPGRCHHDPRRQRCRGRCHRLRDRRRHGFRVGGPRVRISLPPGQSLLRASRSGANPIDDRWGFHRAVLSPLRPSQSAANSPRHRRRGLPRGDGPAHFPSPAAMREPDRNSS
jgi:hypothetical protein